MSTDSSSDEEIDPQRPKKFIINLDLPAEERWVEVVEEYKDQFEGVLDYIQQIFKTIGGKYFGKMIGKFASMFFAALVGTGAVLYGKEIKAIAKLSGFSVGKLAMLNLAYEFSAYCTSIVGQGEDGLILGRTMDWDMPILEKLTIELEFQRKNKTVFYATSWAGYVGILTGMKPGVGAVSINYRISDKGNLLTNLIKGVKSSWPISFLVRDCLEDCKSYKELRGSLKLSKIMAPCYITVCGTKDACLITRTRNGVEPDSTWHYQKKGVIIQCNMDHWKTDSKSDVFYSRKRRKLARTIVEDLENNLELTEESMWTVIYTPPINNEITIYYTVCNPKTGYYVARVPFND
ncbi:acid amidase [Anaeramoeba flamelloides]|uniref:Acid amidase n=1 Tax=Anaeramoeba flamelloides TaxID=1746091 RepID=A0ABQ8XHW0_9EUKA|nr:acid amidase [Anaeramoeba flamelloides]